MPPEEDRYKRALARILHIVPLAQTTAQPITQPAAQRKIVGVGFLVDDAHIFTCAHVVAQALRNADECPRPPKRDDELTLDFPRSGVPDLHAYVVKWRPYSKDPHRGEIDDIAVLRLTDESVATLASAKVEARPQPADVVACEWLKGHPFQAYGYPKSYEEDGCYAYGTIQNRKFNERYQIQGFEQEGGAPVQPGFSGAPVFDTEVQGVVGMIVQSMLQDKTATIIPVDVLTTAWDGLKSATQAVSCAPLRKIVFSPLTPQENPHFTGRIEALADLREQLISDRTGAWKQVITGLGGVGKTQLAVKYAYSYRKECGVIWWMRAEEPATLAGDYAALADELGAVEIGLPESQMTDQAARILKVQNWLNNHPDWLLVFDNAQKPEDIVKYLPQQGNGHVLITSRAQDWGGVAESRGELGVFDRSEAVKFIVERTGQSNETAVGALADELGYLPLALEVAVASINRPPRKSIDEYRALFHERHAKLWEHERPPANYPATLATTWQISFEQAERETRSAADLLAVCAYLGPDNIPMSLFSQAPSSLQSELPLLADAFEFGDAVAALQNCSLITTTDEAISIHRLVQKAERDRLGAGREQKWVGIVVQLVDGAFPSDVDDRTSWPWCATLMPHVLQATEHAERLGVISEQEGGLLRRAGSYLRTHADLHTARLFQERALRIARVLYNEECHEQALAIRSGVCRDKHLTVAFSLTNLGNVLGDLGDYPHAKECHQEALAIFRAVYGEDHPDVAKSLTNLGNVLSHLADYENAKECHKKAIVIFRAVYGEGHPDVAKSLNNLGAVFEHIGDNTHAKECYEQAFMIFRAVYGEKHPETIKTLNNLKNIQNKLS